MIFVIVPLFCISKMLLCILICLMTCHAQGYSSGEDSSEEWASQTEAYEPKKRIVGGAGAKEGEIPYQVSLRTAEDGSYFCSGSIIYTQWILTVAHCLQNRKPSEFKIIAGTIKLNEGGIKYDVNSIFLHENFNTTSFQNDIALIKTTAPIKYMHPNIQSIPLATKETPAGAYCTVSGWGYLNNRAYLTSNHLQKIEVKIVSLETCKKVFRPWNDIRPFTKSQICTYKDNGKGISHGDSGDPLVLDNEVVGISSLAISSNHGIPDIFTKVYAYRKWVKDIVDAN